MVSRRKSTRTIANSKTEKKPAPSKRGKKQASKELNQPSVANTFKVTKKKVAKTSEETKKKRQVNRFNGMSEEEIAKRGLPDYLKEDLDVVFIGINPSMFAAYTGSSPTVILYTGSIFVR